MKKFTTIQELIELLEKLTPEQKHSKLEAYKDCRDEKTWQTLGVLDVGSDFVAIKLGTIKEYKVYDDCNDNNSWKELGQMTTANCFMFRDEIINWLKMYEGEEIGINEMKEVKRDNKFDYIIHACILRDNHKIKYMIKEL